MYFTNFSKNLFFKLYAISRLKLYRYNFLKFIICYFFSISLIKLTPLPMQRVHQQWHPVSLFHNVIIVATIITNNHQLHLVKAKLMFSVSTRAAFLFKEHSNNNNCNSNKANGNKRYVCGSNNNSNVPFIVF